MQLCTSAQSYPRVWRPIHGDDDETRQRCTAVFMVEFLPVFLCPDIQRDQREVVVCQREPNHISGLTGSRT